MQICLPHSKPFNRNNKEKEENGEDSESFGSARHNSVFPGEDSKFIKLSNKIPPRSNVAGYEDRESENGEGVHESSTVAGASPIDVRDGRRQLRGRLQRA